jgi:predicted AlkP superfamily pyrophosphatase or phosphodiesterase
MRSKSFLLFVVLSLVSCQKKIEPTSPKLVVGIVVDQMRIDYLSRFQNHYGSDGFKRFYNQGFIAKNHHFDYAQTKTGPGHASIATGSPPAIHGIIANDWFNKVSETYQYCVYDSAYAGVGTDTHEGKKAPTQLLVSTFADEIRLATQMRGKAIGISLKDRAAILSIGHSANGAYWFSGNDAGNFVSSTFYMQQLPAWVQTFNTSRVIDQYLTTWNTLYPIEQYVESGPDNTVYERIPKGKQTPTFPYDLKELFKINKGYSALEATPFGNSLCTDFALAAIAGEELGVDSDTDVLMLSYSSTDYVGHNFGVNSKELQDTYIRLDKDLARLFSALDKQVGKKGYTVFLTADHGVAHVPQFLLDNRLPAGYFDKKSFTNNLKTAVSFRFGIDDLILNISNNEVYINHKRVAEKRLDAAIVKTFILSEIRAHSDIAEAYSATELMHMDSRNPLVQRLQRGHQSKRSGDIVFTLLPGYLSNGKHGIKGTTHGSAYTYDTHVPFMMFGSGVQKGSTYGRTNITDIAPTITALLGVSNPSGTIGNPIGKALKRH